MLACLLLCLCGIQAAAAGPLDGRWSVREFDPLFPENSFFGQYKYLLRIESRGDVLNLQSPTTGARFDVTAFRDGRLQAEVDDPNRGAATLDVEFSGDTFEGTIRFGSQTRRIIGRRDLADQLQQSRRQMEAVAAEAAAKARETSALRVRLDELNAKVNSLQAELTAATQARRLAEAQRAAALEAAATNRSVQVSRLPADNGGNEPGTTPALRIDLIDPPSEGTSAAVVDVSADGTFELIGRVSSPISLLTLKLNGAEIRILPKGIFRHRLTVPAAGALARIVAVDRDGRRAERRLQLRRAMAPPATAGRDDSHDRTVAEMCQRLAVGKEQPDDQGLNLCRRAVKGSPELALNHYHLGVILSRLGRHQEALLAYQEAAARWSR